MRGPARAPLRPARLGADRPRAGDRLGARLQDAVAAGRCGRARCCASRTATAPTSRCRGSSRASSTCRCSRAHAGDAGRGRRTARELDRRQPGRAGRELDDDDGRRDPRRELGRRARALAPSRRPESRGSSARSRACSCTGASSARTSSGARRAATTTSRTSSACSRSPRSSSAAARAATGRSGRPGELVAEMEHQVRAGRHGARGLDRVPPARDRALRLRDAGRRRARARVAAGLVSRAARPDARVRPRLHAARRAGTADRRRRRRAVPPARRLRRRPARPPPPLRAGRALAGAGGRERRVPGRRLLRPSEREPVRDRPLRRRRPPRTRRPRPQRPALLRARRCPRPARRRPRHLRLHVRSGRAQPLPLDGVPRDAARRRARAERAPHRRPLRDDRPYAGRGALVGRVELRGAAPRLPERDSHAPHRARRATSSASATPSPRPSRRSSSGRSRSRRAPRTGSRSRPRASSSAPSPAGTRRATGSGEPATFLRARRRSRPGRGRDRLTIVVRALA